MLLDQFSKGKLDDSYCSLVRFHLGLNSIRHFFATFFKKPGRQGALEAQSMVFVSTVYAYQDIDVEFLPTDYKLATSYIMSGIMVAWRPKWHEAMSRLVTKETFSFAIELVHEPPDGLFIAVCRRSELVYA
jgi:hypothetical protein